VHTIANRTPKSGFQSGMIQLGPLQRFDKHHFGANGPHTHKCGFCQCRQQNVVTAKMAFNVQLGTANKRFYRFPCILQLMPNVPKRPPRTKSPMAMLFTSCNDSHGRIFHRPRSCFLRPPRAGSAHDVAQRNTGSSVLVSSFHRCLVSSIWTSIHPKMPPHMRLAHVQQIRG
jgi:hypothetical protein